MLRYLRPISVSAIIMIALGNASFAADLDPAAPVYKAPVYKAAVMPGPYNWTGFYVGGNVGYGWGKADNDINYANGASFNAGQGPGDPFPAFAHSDPLKLNGANGGGQFGYNWQFAPTWLLGFEADLQANQKKGSSQFSD